MGDTMTRTSCVHCGAATHLKYCSMRCKSAARYLRLKSDPERYRARLERIRATQAKARSVGRRLVCKCGTEFTQTHGRQKYCGPDCRLPPRRKVQATCACCGALCLKEYRKERRYSKQYCGIVCRDYDRTGGSKCRIPKDHWARWYGASSTWKPKVEASFQCGMCIDCGALICEPASQTPSKFCSERCHDKVKRRRRRAAEHNAPGEYSTTQIIRQYQRQGNVCAYCKQPCTGLPDPEHVMPLSRGGRNDMSNLVAACRPCNADKCDLTLAEWATDRKRRQLTPVDTRLDGPAYKHLWHTEPTAEAWRNRTEIRRRAA